LLPFFFYLLFAFLFLYHSFHSCRWDTKAQAQHDAVLRDRLETIASKHARLLAAQDENDHTSTPSSGDASSEGTPAAAAAVADDPAGAETRAVARASASAKEEAAERAAAIAAWEQEPSWAKEWGAFMDGLQQTCWMPVYSSRNAYAEAMSGSSSSAVSVASSSSSSSSASSSKSGDSGSNNGTAGSQAPPASAEQHLPWPKGGWPPCMAPCRVRPRSDAWACSFTFGLSAKEVRADSTHKLLGWDSRVKPGAVASQLLLLSKAYASATAASVAAAAHAAASAAAANAGAMMVAGTAADPGAASGAARASAEVRSLRAILAQETPKLYRALAASVGTPELKSVARALGERPWLWVGDGFVSTNQV